MWDLTEGLASRGIDCDMLCAMTARDGLSGRYMTIEMGKHGRCICARAWKKVAATMISPAMICWLRRHKNDYDIIHVHHPDPMACLALRLSGYKGRVILHWHSDIIKQKGLLKLYRPLQNWLIRRAETIVGTTPVYVAQSPDLRLAADKLAFCPIGIHDNLRDSRAEIPESDTVTVLGLGRLVEYKGFRYLIDAAGYLPDNYRVVIAGGGPLEGELRSRISAEGLEGKVVLEGFVSDERARELFNSCSVFVLSSIMKTEAFGIVQIEAMSCGKPVIATHIPGSGTDWVNADGQSGLNVPVCDAEAIAEAAMKICGSRKDMERFGKGARKRYEEMFTIDGMIDNIMEIYAGRKI